jgi:CRISPR-associated protein Cmr5
MTLRNNIAQTVYLRISLLATKDATFRTRYGSLAHRLPVLIRTAGLAQAIAFVSVRGKDEGQQLLRDVAHSLGMTDEQLATKSRTAPMLEYMRLTQRTLGTLVWYKRFAQTVLGVDAAQAEHE